jgi:hypothetical protein
MDDPAENRNKRAQFLRPASRHETGLLSDATNSKSDTSSSNVVWNLGLSAGKKLENTAEARCPRIFQHAVHTFWACFIVMDIGRLRHTVALLPLCAKGRAKVTMPTRR